MIRYFYLLAPVLHLVVITIEYLISRVYAAPHDIHYLPKLILQ